MPTTQTATAKRLLVAADEEKTNLLVIDLDAKRAQRAEAVQQEYVIVIGGERFTFPPMGDWPVDTLDQLADGNMRAALAGLIPDDLDRFMGTRPTMNDINALFDSLAKAAGVASDLGNSSAS